jgi:molybdenum cofactor cytidylyltransferase
MDSKKPTAGIILAAGMSNRMNYPKQLIRLKEKFLIEYVIDASLESELDLVVLVLGHRHKAILHALGDRPAQPRMRIEINPAYHEGLSSSIKAGLRSVKDSFPSVMFLLGDQPLVSAGLMNLLINRFLASDKNICAPVFRGRRRNPVLFSSRWYEILLNLTGDTGARSIIESHPEALLQIHVEDDDQFLDIDTESDLMVLRSLVAKRFSIQR